MDRCGVDSLERARSPPSRGWCRPRRRSAGSLQSAGSGSGSAWGGGRCPCRSMQRSRTPGGFTPVSCSDRALYDGNHKGIAPGVIQLFWWVLATSARRMAIFTTLGRWSTRLKGAFKTFCQGVRRSLKNCIFLKIVLLNALFGAAKGISKSTVWQLQNGQVLPQWLLSSSEDQLKPC